MFTNIVELEYRKQQKNLLGVLMVMTVTLATGFALYLLSPRPVVDLLKGLSVGAASSLPIIAFIFGIAAAAGLRSSEKRNAEEAFPFSPRSRVLGAYVLSILLLAIIALPVTVLCWVAREMNFMKSFLMFDSISFAVFSVLYIQLLAFLFTYWVGQPMIGGGLAFVILFLTCLGIALFDRLVDYPFYEGQVHRLISYGICLFILSFAAGSALFFLARFIERSIPLGFRVVPIALAAVMGPVLTIGALKIRIHNLNTALLPVYQTQWLIDPEGRPDRPEIHGALFSTSTGSMIRVYSDGSRHVLFRGEPLGVFETKIAVPQIKSMVVDSHNMVWVLMRQDAREDAYEILAAPRDDSLRSVVNLFPKDVFPETLFVAGQKIYILGRSSHDYLFSEVRFRGKTLEWIPVLHKDELGPYATARSTTAAILSQFRDVAELSKDGSTLAWQASSGITKRWVLNGHAEGPVFRDSMFFMPAYFIDEQPVFSVAVKRSDGEVELVLCLPDGRVENPWERSWGTERPFERRIAGGTVWITGGWNLQDHIVVISDHGRRFPPVSSASIYSQIQNTVSSAFQEKPIGVFPVRISGDRIWLIVKSVFLEMDLNNGKVLHKIQMIADTSSGNEISDWPSEDGIYFLRNGRIQLATWDGQTKDLGKARLPL